MIDTAFDGHTHDASTLTGDDTAYDATSWNDNTQPATKNAIRDKIELMTDTTTTTESVSGAGSIDITSDITLLTTIGTSANNFTLADGSEGQEKIIILKNEDGNAIITPTNFANGTTITFDSENEIIKLLFIISNWYILGGYNYSIT